MSDDPRGVPGKVFVDTNVVIYAHDAKAGRKHDVAEALLRDLWDRRLGVLSTQVLQEFYVNVTRKIPSPLPRGVARDLVGAYASWQVEPIDAAAVVRASEIEEKHRLSFWDALIVAAAEKSGAEKILSEDLNASQRVEGMRIVNPFAG